MGRIVELLAAGIPATLAVTLGAFAIGLLGALPLVALRLAPLAPARWLAAALIDLLRAVPPVVWLFLIFFGLPQAGLSFAALPAAVIGLGLIAAAYIAEIWRAGLDGVPAGQRDAARALGLTPLARLRLVTGPQALAIAVPPLGSYLVGLLKDSAIASTIGVNEIAFRALTESQQSLDGLRVFLITGVIYLALSLPFGLLARWTSARLQRQVAT
ncbi:amino acid ABC transporter permease [Conexibacter stalactiti]|uniref:Amino acid ABC transporter permease n=1 Tax=Conexibacter stalactiti TaxID=1940611 RepID=A0ABU4HP40_9ACTN|nr:amino acid ABC transporter permease [Conexibacter stalactiti]MDW5595067.1 amino acid ABC transporter permease [Conexibacter stalactiti]MEC5035709.1 amino acid ABC transporter permease [Conexibacter stalactiti]